MVNHPAPAPGALTAALAGYDVHEPAAAPGDAVALRPWAAQLREVFEAGAVAGKAELADALLIAADCRPRLVSHGPGLPVHLHYAPVRTGLVPRVMDRRRAGTRDRRRGGRPAASYEVNLGCNYECEHCYLGEKQFAGMDWPGRERLLAVMAQAGVLWLQLTGGEPLIDPLFAQTHATAWDMGMMIQVSSNGSRLDQPRTLELLTARRPYRLTLSIYGATEESYDGMTRRKGSFKRFMRGLHAAHEAWLPMRMNIVVSNRNAHELAQMRAIADRYGIHAYEYANIPPTIHGGAEALPSQAREMLRKRPAYTGCNAGITHFHADPHGRASICKVGRDPQVSLITEGPEGLRRLAAVADSLVTRHGGCSGCTLHKTCGTCMPLVNLYRQAKAPLETYCQHGERR